MVVTDEHEDAHTSGGGRPKNREARERERGEYDT